MTRRWRKADSNPRSRSYEAGCLVSPNQNDQLGARIKFRSSRETAMAACPLGGRSVHGGTDGSNPLSSSGESAANFSVSPKDALYFEDPARALQSLVRAKAILATATNTGAMQAIAGGLGVNGTMLVIGVVGSRT